MKKWLCIALASAILVAAVPIAAGAEKTPTTDQYPVILLPGLLENLLIRDKGEKTQEIVWVPVRRMLRVALKYGPKILYTVYRGTDEQIRALSETVFGEIGEGIRMNPDGTSRDNVSPVVSRAEESSYNALKKSGKLRQVTYGPYMLKEIAAQIGGDRAFIFQYDWRLGPEEVALQLRDFIRDVKKMTGSERVNAAGTSFGSTVLLTYLHKYGADGDLHHVLMNSPAYGGSEIFYEMLAADEVRKVNLENLTDMILSNYGIETDLGALLRLLPEGVADKVFYAGVVGFVREKFNSSISLWGCCSTKDYEKGKAQFLDPAANAEMIRKADYMQHEIMDNAGEIMRGAAQYGTTVYAIANEGAVLATGHGSGDALVDAAGSTGGVYLEVGEHFPADYAPERTVCKDAAHDHVSYTGSLDLTNAYLPETTWVFYGQMHGQNYADTRARALTVKLLTTDEIADVRSDPAFPQFMETASAVSDVSLTLKNSPSGVLDPAKGAVTAVVTNHSHRHCIRVREIELDGVPYKLSRTTLFLLPDASVEVMLTPTGEKAEKYGAMTIRYDEIPNLKLHKSRTQQFRIVGE